MNSTEACLDISRRKLARIADAFENGGTWDDGDICFLIRMAEQRLAASTPQVSPHQIERINGGKGVSIELGTSEYDSEAFLFDEPYEGMVVTFGPGGDILRVEIEDLDANMAPPVPGVALVSPEPDSRAGVEREAIVAACFDPGRLAGPRGGRSTDEWRADAVLAAIQSAPTASAAAGPARDPRVDTQVWTAATTLSAEQLEQPEWLWFANDGTEGIPVARYSFGRWAKVAGQAPYVRADIALGATPTPAPHPVTNRLNPEK